MINAKLVTCAVCHNYYSDPRQIPCTHSFCFDCIVGRLNEETLTLICPKCLKTHEYHSMEQFHARCMRDGFLANMVAQFKRNQSRSAATPAGLSSRPSSSMSYTSPSFTSTPIPTTSPFVPLNQTSTTNHDYSSSERSTPSILNQTITSSTVQSTPTRILIAKCNSCKMKEELIVCSHCDMTICGRCAADHQAIVNVDVKREWDSCKSKYQAIIDQSKQHEIEQEQVIKHARSLQKLIDQQSQNLIRALEDRKDDYLQTIETHLHNQKQSISQEQLIDEYESIDKRLEESLKSNDLDADKVNDFLFEIEHLESRLDNVNKDLTTNELKFPYLTKAKQLEISPLFGTLEFTRDKSQLNNSNPFVEQLPMNREYHWFQSVKAEDIEGDNDDDDDEDSRKNGLHNYRNLESLLNNNTTTSTASVPSKKKLLWQIDYFSVPFYVCTYGNQLFVCDRYGSLAIYKFNAQNDMRQKPTLFREIKLFRDTVGTNSSDDDQTIIDSFVVYKLWIIVFKRKKNELHGTIYLFGHDGKLINNGKIVHNHPSRELTIDSEKNLLWSLDQQQACLFFYKLPDTKTPNPEESFQHCQAHIQFPKPFAPIHISMNKNAVAVLDKIKRAIHVYHKETKQHLYEYINKHSSHTHSCWDMALFSDNSLLMKLDETSTLKSGPSKHIYLQLDHTNQHIIGTIEEIDAYGMMITPKDEIFIGVRINTKGIVKCYV